jgi:hypothetical protein
MSELNPHFVRNSLSPYLDIKSIAKLLQTNSEIAKSIPNNKEFWLQIFKNSGIPVCKNEPLPNTKNGWIQLYIKYKQLLKKYFHQHVTIFIQGFDQQQSNELKRLTGIPFNNVESLSVYSYQSEIRYNTITIHHLYYVETNRNHFNVDTIDADIIQTIINKSIEWCLKIKDF